jgi:outer membrane protein TolC
MRYYFIVIILLWCVPLVSAQSGLYHLGQCMAAADAHTPLARQRTLIDAANQEALALLRNNYRPQATLNAQATWQSEVTQVPIRVPGIEIETLNRDQYRATLDVVQPLWDGGATNQQRKVQEAQTRTEQQRRNTDAYALREQTLQLYCAALLGQQQTKVLATLGDDLQSRKKRAEEQLRNGTGLPMGVQLFEVRLLEVEQQREEAAARTAAALEGLSLLTGLPMTSADQLAPLAAPARQDTTINRPELALFALQQQTNNLLSAGANAKNMPRINAIATLGYARPGLNFLSNEFEPYAIFGVNMRWNLTNLYTGSTNRERAQLRIQNDRISTQRDQFLLLTRVRRSQQQAEIDRLQKLVDKDRNIVRLREQIATTAAVQLDNGILTPSDYLTETTATATARLNQQLHEIQLLQAQWLAEIITGN